MAVSLISTGVQFPDNSIQTSAASGGGAWTFLSTVTASSASTADVETTFDSTYDFYVIMGVNIVVGTNGQQFCCRLKVSGTYQTDYKQLSYGLVSNSAGPSMSLRATDGPSHIILNSTTFAASNLATDAASVIMYVPNPSNTTANKRVYGEYAYQGEGTTAMIRTSFGGTYRLGQGALTGVRFFPDAGVFSGTFRLYGIKNS